MTLQEEREIALREGRGKDFPATPEGWFNHLRKFVRNGARCFKMDPENLIQEHVDRRYANGRTDLENHNLTQVLYHKQMCQGFEDFTKQRAMNHYCAAYAGVQHWGATTMGDNGGGHKALVWMLHYGMSGHMNTSCDMETSPQGMHYGFLQPWSQHNNWSYATQPWFLGKKNEQIYRDYARLRYSLMPYLYSMAHVGHLTSMPILRPMPLAYPDDPALADDLHQYMLGDSLLVAAFTDKVKLPAGRWIDYWTGREYTGPREMTCTYPGNRGGPLFIKAGAIIPYWPEVDYTGEKPAETIQLRVCPEGASEFTLFEDDGNSLEYLKGAVAKTAIRCNARSEDVVITIDPRIGNHSGMVARRGYDLRVRMAQPKSVTVNGAKADWRYDAETGSVCVEAADAPARNQPLIVTLAK
jgi:alpha-glucosidase (family GH31 glycosyl hydrolase)